MDSWNVVRYFVPVVSWCETDRGLGDEIISRGGAEARREDSGPEHLRFLLAKDAEGAKERSQGRNFFADLAYWARARSPDRGQMRRPVARAMTRLAEARREDSGPELCVSVSLCEPDRGSIG